MASRERILRLGATVAERAKEMRDKRAVRLVDRLLVLAVVVLLALRLWQLWRQHPVDFGKVDGVVFAAAIIVAAVAVTAYRPGSLVRAVLHVAVSFGVFALLPTVLGLLLPLVPSQTQAAYVAIALLIPTYLLLSWVWLVARILQELGGAPRGGHPASSNTI